MGTDAAVRDALLASPLLGGCVLDSSAYSVRAYRGGRIISDCPDGVPSVGLVVSGRVDVYSVAVDGRAVQLNSLSHGECFGILNLFAKAEMGTVLRCGRPARVLYLTKAQLKLMMERDSALALRYARICNEKLQFLLRRIEQLTMQSGRSKLLTYLLSNMDESGKVTLPFTREDWANYLGISRAALFRELASLREQGAVLSEGDCLCVPDKQKIEQLLYQPPQN